MRIKTIITAILAVSIPWAAHATNRGYICYQGFDQISYNRFNQQVRTPSAVFECRAEPGGYCYIAGNTHYLGYATPSPGAGTTNTGWYAYPFNDYYYRLDVNGRIVQNDTNVSGGQINATVIFDSADGVRETHTCTVELKWNGWPKDLLIGYGIDASGMVSTGIWKHTSSNVAPRVDQEYWAPQDFVNVGGGLVGNDTPAGALVTRVNSPTYRYGNENSPDGGYGTQDNVIPQPHSHDAYAIGMKIEGFSKDQLQESITDNATFVSGTPLGSIEPHPTVTNAMPVGNQLLSGSVIAVAGTTGQHQYVYETFPKQECLRWALRLRPDPINSGPIAVSDLDYEFYCVEFETTGWQASSKDHMVSAPGKVLSKPMSIAPVIQNSLGRFKVSSQVFTARSPVAQHPSVEVPGAPGDYALTGIGAKVDWSSYGEYGNLLWKLKPRPDIAGAEVGSKDHVLISPATIQGFAIGIKLEKL